MATRKSTTNPPSGADAPVPSTSSADPESRQIKVRETCPSVRWPPRGDPKPRACLRLEGRWLERAGFAIGTHVRVHVAHHRLIVELIEASGQFAEQPGAG